MAKILFILRTPELYDPVGVISLAATLKSKGHEADIVSVSETDVFRAAGDFSPDIVAYSATTGSHRYYYSLNRSLAARYRFFSVMGGPHATFFPQDQPASGMDAFCRGEGEGALVELAEHVQAGADPGGIRNLVVAGKANPLRPLIEDLDSLPFSDRSEYYERAWVRDHPVRSFIVSRGCAYACPYCFNSKWNEMYRGLGAVLRRQSVDRVIDEVNLVRRRYPTQFIRFNDDVFAYGNTTRWLDEFAGKYRARVGLPFECYMRCEDVTHETARLLRKAGCRSVRMGIECGDAGIRARLLARPVGDDRILDAFVTVRQHGLVPVSSTMLALPGGAESTDEESVRFTVRARPGFADFYIYHPYPGTPLGEYAREQGIFEGDFQSFSAYFGSTPSPLKCFSPGRKRRQMLLSAWGTVAAYAPAWSEFILACLSRIPSQFLGFLLYFAVKVLANRRISPVRMPVWRALRQLANAFRLERDRRYARANPRSGSLGFRF
ncbi:MAG: radical SAM protein [Planctomycetota bacterium]|nr:radical SAM protein [Planctomycetota bacterium]